jgi:DNA-binding transcriptional ArsR family regulator
VTRVARESGAGRSNTNARIVHGSATEAPSTLSHHFKVLREAGVIHQLEQGNRRWTTLRRAELDDRFPGLIDTVLRSAR